MKSELSDTGRGRLRSMLADAVAYAVTLGLLAAIVASDRYVFAEPEPSPLFQATLQKAYSRFGESNMVVEAQRRRSPHAAGIVDAQNAGVVARRSEKRPPVRERPEYKEAEAAAKAGDNERALRGFQALLNESPEGGRSMNGVRHRVADMLVLLDRDEEAIELYRHILKQDNDHVCCFRHLGDIYRRLDRRSMADRMYGSLVAGLRRLLASPGSRTDHWRRELVSFYLDEKRDLPEALRLMKLDLGVAMTATDRFLLARCQEANRHFDEAIETLASIRSDDEKLMQHVASFQNQVQTLRNRDR